ncbi:hypothetical protein TNCV_1204681 [Trichonephila clavipes]|nr:hypothetical protein TNCV_1204681 [Trichonephila clavipes]
MNFFKVVLVSKGDVWVDIVMEIQFRLPHFSKTFTPTVRRRSTQTVLYIDCHYSSIHDCIKTNYCSQKPYYNMIFRSGRIHVLHDLTFDVIPLTPSDVTV